MWEANQTALDAADAAWNFLRTLPGIGWVIAGKLLARKRPRLVPIFDSVIEKVLQPPPGRFWVSLAEALRDADRRTRVEGTRPAGAEAVSLIRLVDVAVWMRFSQGGNALLSRGETRS